MLNYEETKIEALLRLYYQLSSLSLFNVKLITALIDDDRLYLRHPPSLLIV